MFAIRVRFKSTTWLPTFRTIRLICLFLPSCKIIRKRLPEIRKGLERGDAKAREAAEGILALKREALLANPLLDFDKLLLIKRVPIGDPRRPKGDGKGLGKFLGLPQQSSWQQDSIPGLIPVRCNCSPMGYSSPST